MVRSDSVVFMLFIDDDVGVCSSAGEFTSEVLYGTVVASFWVGITSSWNAWKALLMLVVTIFMTLSLSRVSLMVKAPVLLRAQ